MLCMRVTLKNTLRFLRDFEGFQWKRAPPSLFSNWNLRATLLSMSYHLVRPTCHGLVLRWLNNWLWHRDEEMKRWRERARTAEGCSERRQRVRNSTIIEQSYLFTIFRTRRSRKELEIETEWLNTEGVWLHPHRRCSTTWGWWHERKHWDLS